jgi:c-di-GMP-binding flagellar brake protein YcgR
MTSPMERRRFSRIMVSLPVEYHTRLPDTDAPFQGQGVLRDISLGGTYFHVDPDTSFQPGQILSLTVSASLPYLQDTDISHLQATGEVIRFDPPAPNRPQAGVALNFLGGLTFCATHAQPIPK